VYGILGPCREVDKNKDNYREAMRRMRRENIKNTCKGKR
jgi:hypothetical protein